MRYRVRSAAVLKPGALLRAVLLCLFFGGTGLGYVWQKNQIHALGKKVKAAEVRLERTRLENQQLALQWNRLRSPAWLEARIRELSLHLVPPQPNQVVRLMETEPLQTDGAGPGRLANFSEQEHPANP